MSGIFELFGIEEYCRAIVAFIEVKAL